MMKYQKIIIKQGLLTIKDAEESEFKELVGIYKSAFTKHNIFKRASKKILAYLKSSNSRNSVSGGGYVVAKLGNIIVGGILVAKKNEDQEGKHMTWKYNHLSVALEYRNQGIGTELINAADHKIINLIKKGKIKTAKIEVTVSDNEKSVLKLSKKCGFEIEGRLRSHYRYGESAYILGKEIPE